MSQDSTMPLPLARQIARGTRASSKSERRDAEAVLIRSVTRLMHETAAAYHESLGALARLSAALKGLAVLFLMAFSPAVLPAQLEAVHLAPAAQRHVLKNLDGELIERCSGDRLQVDRSQSLCLPATLAPQLGRYGEFEARAYHWAPGSALPVCTLSGPLPCCLRPLVGLDRDGEEKPNSFCRASYAPDPSPAAVLCGWDARDFDLAGCADECIAELEAAGWPAPGAPDNPGELIGVTCCARAPLTAPRPLPADVSRCHATM